MVIAILEQISWQDILTFITPALYFVATIVATWVVSKIVNILIRRTLKFLPPLILAHAQKASSIIIWTVGILFAITRLGLSIEVVILLIALGGIALIIAMRDILANIASKYFSDFYVPYKLGDRISIAGYTGSVMEINPIVTVLLTDDNKLVSIPNSYFINNIAVNETREAWKEIIIPVHVDKELDISEVEAEILKRLIKLRSQLDERMPPVVNVKKLSSAGADLEVILKIKSPMQKSKIAEEANRRIMEALEEVKTKVKK